MAFAYDDDRYPRALPDRLSELMANGIRLAKRVFIAFGLAVFGAIVIGAVATDNGFVQFFVTLIAAIALWPPILFALLWIGRRRSRRPTAWRSSATTGASIVHASAVRGTEWARLARALPDQRERIEGLQRSIERSRIRLGGAALDADAPELCALIDRRLPSLIEHELNDLPPDDRGRREKLGSLVDLVDQFARHCHRHGGESGSPSQREAEILRRRFEQRLAPSPFDGQ